MQHLSSVELEYNTIIAERLKKYRLSYKQLEEMGYPVPHTEHSDQAVINYQPYPSSHRKYSSRLVHCRSTLNASADEFMPKSASSFSEEVDSGNGSSSEDSSDQELENNSDGEQHQLNCIDRTCAHCYGSFYMVRETCEYMNHEKCTYHWGKCSHRECSSRLVHCRSTLNANADEFMPKSASSSSEEIDSGNGSSSEDSSDQELENNSDGEQHQLHCIERTCARCYGSFYMVRETCEYMNHEKCTYHWGKCHRNGVDEVWTCCQAPRGARGCATGARHVWTGILPGRNGSLQGFVRTKAWPGDKKDKYLGIYALDCETLYTRYGIEVGKVTIIELGGKVCYETLVKPTAPVIDYNTRFSGLRVEDFYNVKKTLRDVQRDILRFIYSETILIGHGLENDLRALKIIHLCVVDTAVLYPHSKGLPYRNSLKALAKNILGKTIQKAEHDSAEDARTALDLVEMKLSTEKYYTEDDMWITFE